MNSNLMRAELSPSLIVSQVCAAVWSSVRITNSPHTGVVPKRCNSVIEAADGSVSDPVLLAIRSRFTRRARLEAENLILPNNL